MKRTLGFGLIYTRNNGNNILTEYLDSDLAGHVEDIKSTSDVAFYLNESLITWGTQK